jgi:mannose-6-phosphate isomerase-like protein (cupin superfamily)
VCSCRPACWAPRGRPSWLPARSIRRVVTGVDAEGRSCVLSDAPLDLAGISNTLWNLQLDQLPEWAWKLGGDAVTASQPPAGGSRWSLIELPPWEQFVRFIAENPLRGLTADGFHTTRTVDYVYILGGPLQLVLDTGPVDLRTGDTVVQQATRHAWRNPGPEPVRFLVVLTTYPEAPG